MTREVLERELSEHVASMRRRPLPPATVEAVRRCVLDTAGVMLAGSSGAGISTLVTQLRPGSPGREATAAVFGSTHDVLDAVWLNGAMARAWEFDDSHDPSGDHSSVPVLASALGAAELAAQDGQRVDGATFLAAFVAGVDVSTRLRLGTTALLHETGFATNTYAPFAAAATAAVILGLDAEQTYDALGWAYAQCAGSVQAQQGGGSTLHVHHGLAASTGVQAALLARAGLPGTPSFLTGKFGFFHNYCRGGLDESRALDGLGERFEIERVSPKLYPSGRVTHGAIDAALELYHEDGVRAADIERVVVYYSRLGYTMTCQPEDERRFPSQPHHATFSLYYSVASALAHGTVDLDSFTATAIADESTARVNERIEVHVDESVSTLLPIRIQVELADGRVVERRVDALKGTPERPVDLKAYIEKFHQCADHAAIKIPLEQRDHIIGSIRGLAELEDIPTDLVAALKVKP